jgi:hypothetical protein
MKSYPLTKVLSLFQNSRYWTRCFCHSLVVKVLAAATLAQWPAAHTRSRVRRSLYPFSGLPSNRLVNCIQSQSSGPTVSHTILSLSSRPSRPLATTQSGVLWQHVLHVPVRTLGPHRSRRVICSSATRRDDTPPSGACQIRLRPASASDSVMRSAYSRSPPLGSPNARRDTAIPRGSMRRAR